MTKIFKNYADFLNREDKNINGVSVDFAEENPNWQQDNESNIGCWNCKGCSDCSDCIHCWNCGGCSVCSGCRDCRDCRDCSYCSNCSGCRHCSDCRGCSHCSDCRGCSGCRDCRDCSYCSNCSDCNGCSGCSDCNNCIDLSLDKKALVPVIDNIHQKVFEAAKGENALRMDKVHTCNTTHCRAGWVVHLAGEAGYKFEQKTSWEFAAMQIYKASSKIKVSPVRFYETNEQALSDMERCAKEEREQNSGLK